ncbi:MAG: hypothetical protein ACK4HV_03720 [Parachlamydiaceae bacterium]
MNPSPSTILAIKAGPFENHYTTYKHNRFRYWKIHEGRIQRSVSFIIGQVFKPSSELNQDDVKLLPKNAAIQFCGKYRFIELSQYIFKTGQEVFISFFLSEYYVVHPYLFITQTISFDTWQERRLGWYQVENFPDISNRINIDYRTLQRLLFSIHLMDSKKIKIP